MLVYVYTCKNATLLEITCHGSFYFTPYLMKLQNLLFFQLQRDITQKKAIHSNRFMCLEQITH